MDSPKPNSPVFVLYNWFSERHCLWTWRPLLAAAAWTAGCRPFFKRGFSQVDMQGAKNKLVQKKLQNVSLQGTCTGTSYSHSVCNREGAGWTLRSSGFKLAAILAKLNPVPLLVHGGQHALTEEFIRANRDKLRKPALTCSERNPEQIRPFENISLKLCVSHQSLARLACFSSVATAENKKVSSGVRLGLSIWVTF